MNKLHDLMRKLQAIEEAAKKSDIPAAHRKAQNPEDWKVTQHDLDKEEHEGKISHAKELAKNSGRADEGMDDPVSDAAPEQSDVASITQASDSAVEECGGDDMGGRGNVQLTMQDLLALMTHLQKGQVGVHDEPLMGDEEHVGEEFANSVKDGSEQEEFPVSTILPTGNDMFSKGKEAPKVNGGGNPMEAALAELYANVKARQLDELSNDTLKSYTKKAASDMNDAAFTAGHDFAKGHKHHSLENDKKSFKRQHGIEKAVDKMTMKEANQMVRKLRK